jgi:hypothetical protein
MSGPLLLDIGNEKHSEAGCTASSARTLNQLDLEDPQIALFAVFQYCSITRCQHKLFDPRSGYEEPVRRIPLRVAGKQRALRCCGGIERHKSNT